METQTKEIKLFNGPALINFMLDMNIIVKITDMHVIS